ncbi:MAG TPA: hypothetical protein PLP20_00965 [Oscillospiraceae bacterium]|nr:hypothetical protein [Oscillospiraceae bacterium]
MMMQKLRDFMYGRNGTDALALAFLAAGVLLGILYRFTGWIPVYGVSLACYIYSLFRTFSRSVGKRRAENAKFVGLWWKAKNRWGLLQSGAAERKAYRHFHCPNCRQKIRVPRGRGRIEIRCPSCGTAFIKKV